MLPEEISIGTWFGLKDAVCVVTGAGAGIGAETARLLASVGARVAVVDRNGDTASSVAAAICQSGGHALGIACDISDADEVRACGRLVLQKLGPCRVLVNNAAARHRAPVLDIDLDAWSKVLAVNLNGALICSQIFARQMIDADQGGSLVHVGSILGQHPQHAASAYCASKAGLAMLSKSLSIELAPHRIRSNVVSPGFVVTEANAASYQDPATRFAREQLIPAQKIGSPADLSHVILMLASERSGYITGDHIQVDGGVSNTALAKVPRA